ncbi:DUF4430 domain-containing protein [Clostridium botulinum]|uniref:DUF4430 domain-containing protein n=1 Tax=Clostridium botulinum TaxID=1491 RepID=A0A6B4R1U3_CLOBO|nr:DUF4430 domain-containing protein [Clostridium botulinum]EES48892.1 hypothetical protein CLO_0444 [Clostridium botulinum E1 str. 'BoNT E Beluga']MBY6759636.1 DUF4430 domain-containing protein [Clostridium botulinum]MBY6918544.1 DUF4430 domain-containing protein [Clostridium botulinum]MCR1129628.1 DUF4430 domain-containing protein [Clostridium botulinum]NFG22604.1 DUF4430 domain-containing protein [Clostridium botulinum]
MKIKNKKILVSIIVILMAVVGLVGYKISINSKAVQGMKQYKLIITDTENTFNDEFRIKTEETSLGKDLDNRDLIEAKEGPYGRFVTSVHGKVADEERQEWWQLIINGEASSVAVDDVMIHDGDEVRFILTTGW